MVSSAYRERAHLADAIQGVPFQEYMVMLFNRSLDIYRSMSMSGSRSPAAPQRGAWDPAAAHRPEPAAYQQYAPSSRQFRGRPPPEHGHYADGPSQYGRGRYEGGGRYGGKHDGGRYGGDEGAYGGASYNGDQYDAERYNAARYHADRYDGPPPRGHEDRGRKRGRDSR